MYCSIFDFALKQVKIHVSECFNRHYFEGVIRSGLYIKCFRNNCEILLFSENQTGKNILFYPDENYVCVFFVSHSSLNEKTSVPLCTSCTNGFI